MPIHGYQHGTNAITTSKLVEYVHDQINRWDDSPDALDPAGYPRYRPDTIRQTVNALIYWAERSTGQPPDDRAAKEALRRFADNFNRTHPAAWRVSAPIATAEAPNHPATVPVRLGGWMFTYDAPSQLDGLTVGRNIYAPFDAAGSPKSPRSPSRSTATPETHSRTGRRN